MNVHTGRQLLTYNNSFKEPTLWNKIRYKTGLKHGNNIILHVDRWVESISGKTTNEIEIVFSKDRNIYKSLFVFVAKLSLGEIWLTLSMKTLTYICVSRIT